MGFVFDTIFTYIAPLVSSGLWVALTLVELIAVLAPFALIGLGCIRHGVGPKKFLANHVHPITGTLGMFYVPMSLVAALLVQAAFLFGAGAFEFAGVSGASAPVALAGLTGTLIATCIVMLVVAAFTLGPVYLFGMGGYEMVRDFSHRKVEPSWTTRVYITMIYWLSAAFMVLIDLAVIPIAGLVLLTLLPTIAWFASLLAVYVPMLPIW